MPEPVGIKGLCAGPNGSRLQVVKHRGPLPVTNATLYAYVAESTDRLADFHEAEKRPAFFPDEYGVIIESGEGEPSEEVKQRITRE